MSKKIKTLVGIVAALVVCMGLCGVPAAYAAEVGSISLTCSYDSAAVGQMEYRLYRVGTWTDAGGLELEDPWNQAGVSLDVLTTASDWRTAAEKLAEYAGEKDIQAVETAVTDGAGKATFTGLDEALYLLVSEGKTTEAGTYSGVPELLALPSEGEMSLSIEPKIGFEAAKKDEEEPSSPSDAEKQGEAAAQDQKKGEGPLSWTGDATIPVAVAAILVVAGVAFVVASRRKPASSNPSNNDE